MTKTSQQLAEELARKFISDMEILMEENGEPLNKKGYHKAFEKQILQSIPLVELLEFVAATSKYRYTFCNAEEQAYELLTTKLYQLGIEI